MDGMDHVDEVMKQNFTGFCFTNLVDFDTMFGHRRDPQGFGQAIMDFDRRLGKVLHKLKNNDLLIVTADHGNADQMVDYKTGELHTAHTTNPVPLVIVGKDVKIKEGRLADLAPTMLDLMGIEKPEDMTGESLIEK